MTEIRTELEEHVLTLYRDWGLCRCGWSTRYGTSDERNEHWRTHVEAAMAILSPMPGSRRSRNCPTGWERDEARRVVGHAMVST
jgi:hypothetical protein